MDFTRLKQLFTEEDAVSPVIGVILMVAITVILAAVIGTFVLGLGENVQDSAPQANFQFEYDDNGNGFADADDSLTITHTGGEDVSASQVSVQVAGKTLWSAGTPTDVTATGWGDPIQTGSTLELTETATPSQIESNDAVRVVWTSPSGSNSNTIGQSTVPS